MACAKKLGLKVFLDVVVNHTADVISYTQGNAYVSLGRSLTAPQRVGLQPLAYTGGTEFPRLAPSAASRRPRRCRRCSASARPRPF